MEFILIEPIFQICCGLSHTTILQKTSGHVYTCGNILMGRDFDDNKLNKLNPVIFPKKIKEISCESFATIAYSTDNTRYTYGCSEYENFCSLVELISKFSVSIKYSHNKISRGADFELFLCADGKLCLVGNDTYSRKNIKYSKLVELGLNEPYKIVQIGCYGKSIFVLTDCGWMYSWGNNGVGQLGLGNVSWYSEPTKIDLNDVIAFSCGRCHAVALDKSHNVWEWGRNYCEYDVYILSPKRVPLDNVLQLCCGGQFTMALDLDRNLYGWGNNTSGELGLGDYDSTSKPRKLVLEGVISIACGEHHVVALTLQNEIYVWGENRYGQLGLGDYEMRNSPQKLEFDFGF